MLEGYNPLCGDKVTVFLELERDRVQNVSFQGSGCAISTASASVMTESVKGKTLAEVEALRSLSSHGHGEATGCRERS